MPLSTLLLKSLGLTFLFYAATLGGGYLLAIYFDARIGIDTGVFGHLMNAIFYFILAFGVMHMPSHRRMLGVAAVFLLVTGILVYAGSEMSRATKVNVAYLD